jgi:hypothetical protein
MKPISAFSLILAGLLAGLVASMGTVPRAEAQAAAETQPGRYQVSAYAAHSSTGNFGHGCYIVDTTTGEVWHARAGGERTKVSERLR